MDNLTRPLREKRPGGALAGLGGLVGVVGRLGAEDAAAIGRLGESMKGIAPKRRLSGTKDWRALAPLSDDAEE